MHLDRLGPEARKLQAAQQARSEFLTAYPGIVVRIGELDRAITQQQHQLRTSQTRPPVESYTPDPAARLRHDPHLDHVHHHQIAQALQAPQIGGPGI